MYLWFLTQPEAFTLLAIILAFVAAFTATSLVTVTNGRARVAITRTVLALVILTAVVAVFATGLWFRWWWL
ncbi:hypothetical protein MRBLWO14_000949 [Microbacterium sp. LWO14-1.2]|uniref:hypothetical protein n=1 Tax=Microbacterium sp. LWO14-1.2 TaxID=3135263 RepID=UPI003139CCA8